MKILLITSFFPPTHTAGTEKRTLGYAQGLRDLDHEVQLVCAGDWDTGDRYWNGFSDETYQQIPIRRIHLNWSLAPDPNRFLYDNPVVERHIDRWLEEWKPDIVHITSCLTLSASVIRASKNKQLPVVLTMTDFWFICPKVNLVRWDSSHCDGRTTDWDCLKCLMWDTRIYQGLNKTMPNKVTEGFLKWASGTAYLNRVRGFRGKALDMNDRKSYLKGLIQSVDRLVAPSAFLGRVIEDSGVPKPIRIIRSGHDLTWLETMPPKSPTNTVRIGYIGQIIPIKGIHILISSFISASLEGKAQLSIYGDPNKNPVYTQSLETLINGWNRIIKFRGSFPFERLGEVFSEIDVLVAPSQWHENNPRVIQESFASRTPVIASNVGGISEFVKHDVNGLLFEHDNVDDLTYQLQRIVSEPGLIEHLRDGITSVKSLQEEIIELETLYQEVLYK